MRLYPIPPYDFARTVNASLTMFIMSEVHDGAYRRVIRVGDAIALIEATNQGTLAAPEIDVEVLAARGEINEAALWQKVRRVFNVEADLKPFYELAQRDPVLAETIATLYGLHSLQADSMFEALVLTMIEQQIALKMANNAERWLLTWGGESLAYEGATYFVFPSVERMAAATVTDLTPLKITFARMQRMIDLAQAAASGAIDLEALRDLPFEETYKALMNLNGVGHWTAAWALIRSQGQYPYVGAADVALRAAINSYYFGQPGRADVTLVDQTFAQYGTFSGVAAFYTLMRWAFERY